MCIVYIYSICRCYKHEQIHLDVPLSTHDHPAFSPESIFLNWYRTILQIKSVVGQDLNHNTL